MDEDVLPGDEGIVEDEDRVVLVVPRRERIIPGRAGRGRGIFVGRPADQLDARRVHRRDEHHHHARIGDFLAHILAEEIVIGQRRIGGDDLGAGHIDAGVGLLLDGDIDVLDLFDRLVAVDRRIDQRVVEEQHGFLAALVPGARIVGELAVELGIGAERVEERRLVIGAPAEPAVSDARPGGDGVALRDHVLAALRHLEEFVGVAAGAGIGRRGEHVLGRLVVQRVVEQRDGAGRIAERRMFGDVLDALAVDVDLAVVLERLQEFGAGERALLAGDDRFGVVGHLLNHGFLRTLACARGWACTCSLARFGVQLSVPAICQYTDDYAKSTDITA